MQQIKHIINLILKSFFLFLKDLDYYVQPPKFRNPYPPSFYSKYTPEEQELIEQKYMDKIYKLIDSMETPTDKDSE